MKITQHAQNFSSPSNPNLTGALNSIQQAQTDFAGHASNATVGVQLGNLSVYVSRFCEKQPFQLPEVEKLSAWLGQYLEASHTLPKGFSTHLTALLGNFETILQNFQQKTIPDQPPFTPTADQNWHMYSIMQTLKEGQPVSTESLSALIPSSGSSTYDELYANTMKLVNVLNTGTQTDQKTMQLLLNVFIPQDPVPQADLQRLFLISQAEHTLGTLANTWKDIRSPHAPQWHQAVPILSALATDLGKNPLPPLKQLCEMVNALKAFASSSHGTTNLDGYIFYSTTLSVGQWLSSLTSHFPNLDVKSLSQADIARACAWRDQVKDNNSFTDWASTDNSLWEYFKFPPSTTHTGPYDILLTIEKRLYEALKSYDGGGVNAKPPSTAQRNLFYHFFNVLINIK